jgi:hypothetical protein
MFKAIYSWVSEIDEWAVSPPSCFALEVIITGTHWIGDWLGLGAVLEAVRNRTPILGPASP